MGPPVRGADHIARHFLGFVEKAPLDLRICRERVKGEPALSALAKGEIVNLLTFDVVNGRIATCFAGRNPCKLK
jgi:RNA polymerase sigma-70 factor (ECF subfamily)